MEIVSWQVGVKMRILVFASYFLPHRGGLENYVYQTSKRLVERGHKVWVVTSKLKGMKDREVIDGIKVVRVPAFDILPHRLPLPFVLSLSRKIGVVDVVVTHTRFYPLSFFGGLYARYYGIPWLHVEHGSKQVAYANPVVNATARVVDAVFGRWILNHAFVAGVSKASCVFAKKLGAKSCSILYNGVDTKFFDGKLKKHKGIKIAFVGRLIKEKGVQDLLKAVKGLNVEVVIVGKGPFEKDLKKLGGKFVGEKDSAGVREILSQSDILANPSYGEGLPTCVLEAGAMGLPVIATDVGGTSEIIDNGKNGFLVKPGDIKALRKSIFQLNKASLREKFGKNLQKKVKEKFDWDSIVINIEKVLRSLR